MLVVMFVSCLIIGVYSYLKKQFHKASVFFLIGGAFGFLIPFILVLILSKDCSILFAKACLYTSVVSICMYAIARMKAEKCNINKRNDKDT